MIFLPTLDQVVAELEKHGAERTTLNLGLQGPRGPVSIEYLARKTGDDNLLVTEPLPEDESLLTWDRVDRLCRQLHIDPETIFPGKRPPPWWLYPDKYKQPDC